ncbi:mechanosensitive ion channel family protein [Cytophaga aurantiaca]|uniref:mechanosensitive ion channel family protein n=1 Tax=Cytophaga aurantiaca TaxID=29530 RepID=UPI0003A91AA5|nr:mechanosensitive ion channel family protein [Cytophaga aurantiaca]
MIEFISQHSTEIIFLFVIAAIVFVLQLVTNLLYSFFEKKQIEKFPNEEPVTLHLVKIILKTLWYILGMSAASFVFISKDLYAQAAKNFWVLTYLGFILLLTVIGASVVQTLFARTIRHKIKNGEDPTSHRFLRYLAVLGIYFFGIILAILAFPSLRGTAHTALGGAGVIALIAGVASQEALSNIVGGIFIIIFKPFKINDIIEISGAMIGTVTDITLRHTTIRNSENKMIVVPNAIINKEKIINYDLGNSKCCQMIEIGISYTSNIDLAKEIMRLECEAHPNLIEYRTLLEIKNEVPKVIVRVIELAESAVILRAWAWSKDYTSGFIMKCDLYESIKKRFDKENIEIPFPSRMVVVKNPDSPLT